MTRIPADTPRSTTPRGIRALTASILFAVMLTLGSVLVPASVAAAQPTGADSARVTVTIDHAALQTGASLVEQLVAVLRQILADQEAAPPVSGDSDIVSIIYAAADYYGQPRADMLRVARCESNLIPTAVNPSSNASGLFQFLPSTWATTPYADRNIFDPVANAYAAAWMWDNGRRNEWVCQ